MGLSANRPSLVVRKEQATEPTRVQLKGAPMRTARNMDASLSMPTATSVRREVPDYAAALVGDAKGLRIGVERQHHSGVDGFDPVPRSVRRAVRALEAAGGEVVEVTFDGYPLVTAAAMVTVAGEVLAYHLKDLQSRFGDYGREARAALAMGAFYNSADYVQASGAPWGLDTLRPCT